MSRFAMMTAALLLCACSDDGGAVDQGATADQGPVADGPQLEAGPLPEAGPPPADTGPTPDVGLPTQNSGAICVQGGTCPNPSEECIVFDPSLGKGMCLDSCAQKGDACPVPDQTTQISTCSVTGLTPGTWYCGWFCELGGKTYKCPNDTDYQCVDPGNGVAKFCQPK